MVIRKTKRYPEDNQRVKRIELEQGDKVRIKTIEVNGHTEEPIGYFMPGVLTLTWEPFAHLEK